MGKWVPIEQRFWPKVNKKEGCWLWAASHFPNGYGQIKWRREQYAHRVAWILVNGPIPKGLLVCHHCDNPTCVNPHHLFVGTYSDNMRDASRKGRRKGPTKLSAEQVLAIFDLASCGVSQDIIATTFSVCRDTVSLIKHRHIWKQLLSKFRATRDNKYSQTGRL